MVLIFLVRRNACRKKKLTTNAQEKSKNRVTFYLATTHILNVVHHLTELMIFLIDKVDFEHQVIVYKSITDLTQRVEWQDVFEGKSIIIDKNGTEYEWDSSKKNEIGTVYNYTLIRTSKVSELIDECLKIVSAHQNICEFNF